ncbi:SET and MYND domain-containing protein 4-like [Neodiprion virginianus]|uniref:SET and MYND domain-containing protein 4-like n=1 Tax=Neodiprion virginianus TaxID=2961670 RepID=UPI001EE6CFA9|nr:SET and MYND domain-containing protein 4-like [Neodiprion virginianus]XP_046603723.1 SET and MYND domain-containing protein 4-like [Neodiprion virginianus]
MQWQTFLDAVNCKLRNGRIFQEIKRNRRSECEVMSYLIGDPDVRKLMLLWLQEQLQSRESKSSSKAKQLKDLGNKEFQRKNYASSIPLYTKSAQYAVADELSIAIANRSAALYYMDNFKDCLKDIDLAINIGYPKKLLYKLYIRNAQCYIKLKNRVMAEVAIEKVEEIVNACNEISAEKKDDIFKEVSLLKSLASNLENIAENDSSRTQLCQRPDVAFESNANFPFASAALDCKYTPQKGRHVIANRDIQKGQVLFVEKPFAFVVLDQNDSSSFCRHCCHPYGAIPIPCKTCVGTLYCSSECLDNAWSGYHKWECPGAQMRMGQQIGIAHLSLKVLLVGSTTEDKERFNEVQKLVTNIDKVSPDDLLVYGITAVMLTMYLSMYTDFFTTVDLKKSFADKFIDSSIDFNCDVTTESGKQLYVSSFLLRHTLQLICNGHAITKLSLDAQENDKVATVHQERIATGIYPAVSMMNHSCDPNIINSFDDQYLIVKATKDIPAGGEVFNCYGPHFRRTPRDERQEILRNQYCFTCTCEACTNPELQYFLERFSSLKCLECNGAVFKISSSLSCFDCGATPALNHNSELREAQNLFDAAHVCIEMENDDEALNKLKQCLNIRRSILYKHHQDIINTLDLIGKVYAISGRWLDSISYLEHVITGIGERFGTDSIELANELNKITDICLPYLQEETNTRTKQYKNALKKTRRFLDHAKQIMDLNYGPWNSGFQEIEKKAQQLSAILRNFNI